MPSIDTAPDRIALLLPWLNGDDDTEDETRARIADFLRAFDGSAAAGHVRVYGAAGERELFGSGLRALPRRPPVVSPEDWAREQAAVPIDAAGLDSLRTVLVALLRVTPPAGQPTGPRVRALPSLAFSYAPRARRAFRAGAEGRRSAAQRDAERAPGAYELWVDGELADLLPFLVVALLTAPGMAAVQSCAAPMRNQPGKVCGRWFIKQRGRGAPKRQCSPECTGIKSNEKKKGIRAVKREKGEA